MKSNSTKHIIIIGAGFGGLACARKLSKHKQNRVTLIDRHNHHLFQPLLYQVATATLTSPDIACSIRSLFSDQDTVDVVYDEVIKVDLNKKTLELASGKVADYDALVIATGARTNFFGNDHWAEYVHQLKSLQDAIAIRKTVLRNLEYADQLSGEQQDILSTVVIVGGGPTGVELAGAFCDLIKRNMKRSFRRFDPNNQRIILLEGQNFLLGAFAEDHQKYAKEHLEKLGVDVRTEAFVEDIQEQKVTLKSGEVIQAGTIIWAAGVEANPVTKTLAVELKRGGFVAVENDLSIKGYPFAFVIGDSAAIEQPDGSYVPGVAPAATQGGEHVAEIIATQVLDEPRNAPFFYKDKGKMAIVGKGSAVVQIKNWKLKGAKAWFIWLFVHLLFLVNFRNKLSVLISWFWAYIRKQPGSRVFTSSSTEKG